MGFEYGFYDSTPENPKRYNTEQISRLFDGLITDGVFPNVGKSFNVVPTNNGRTIMVESGRAWFNHTWSYIDDSGYIVPEDEIVFPLLLKQTACLVLIIDEDKKENRFEIIYGEVSDIQPKLPEIEQSETIHKYTIANILLDSEIPTISETDISYVVGSDVCPLVVGILDKLELTDYIDNVVQQFQATYDNNAKDLIISAMELTDSLKNGFSETLDDIRGEIINWYNNLSDNIDENAAVNLQNQIGDLSESPLLSDFGPNTLAAMLNRSSIVKSKYEAPDKPYKYLEGCQLVIGDPLNLGDYVASIYIPKMITSSNNEAMANPDDYLTPGTILICQVINPQKKECTPQIIRVYDRYGHRFRLTGTGSEYQTAVYRTANWITSDGKMGPYPNILNMDNPLYDATTSLPTAAVPYYKCEGTPTISNNSSDNLKGSINAYSRKNINGGLIFLLYEGLEDFYSLYLSGMSGNISIGKAFTSMSFLDLTTPKIKVLSRDWVTKLLSVQKSFLSTYKYRLEGSFISAPDIIELIAKNNLNDHIYYSDYFAVEKKVTVPYTANELYLNVINIGTVVTVNESMDYFKTAFSRINLMKMNGYKLDGKVDNVFETNLVNTTSIPLTVTTDLEAVTRTYSTTGANRGKITVYKLDTGLQTGSPWAYMS